VYISAYCSAVNTLLTKLCQHIFTSCSKLLTVKEPSHYDTFSAYFSVFPFSNLEQNYTCSFKWLWKWYGAVSWTCILDIVRPNVFIIPQNYYVTLSFPYFRGLMESSPHRRPQNIRKISQISTYRRKWARFLKCCVTNPRARTMSKIVPRLKWKWGAWCSVVVKALRY
jgi:hypothetical protein